MRTLNEKDIIHIMTGATLMAGGGGGALADGMELIDTYKKNYPGMEMKCDLYRADEMGEDQYTIGLAVMGSPVEGGKVDATGCIITAFEQSRSLKERTGRTADYTLSMELGGFNTFTPILISMIEGIPMVDADCAGRAVPGLETAISNVNGLPTGPYVMGSIEGNAYVVVPKDPYDAAYCQQMALPIVRMFRQNAGMAGWMYNRRELEECVPTGTIEICRRIGQVMEELSQARERAGLPFIGNVFEALNRAGVVEARTLAENAVICNYCPQPGVTGNNDIGLYDVKQSADADEAYRIHYANESLVLGLVKDGAERTVMTVPDITAMYDARTGQPLTNEDITLAHENGTLEELRVTLGAIRVDAKWWKNEAKLMEYWSMYFEEIGYKGEIVKF